MTPNEHLTEILRLIDAGPHPINRADLVTHYWAAIADARSEGASAGVSEPLPAMPLLPHPNRPPRNPPCHTRTARLEIRLEHAIFGLRSWRGCVVSESTDQHKFVFFADADDPLESRCINFAWNALNYLEVRNK